MSNPIPATEPSPADLKSAALTKINAARALLDAARQDMCNLEGRGYCDHYERKFRELAPPTGMFRI
jgi:hypothetical protein